MELATQGTLAQESRSLQIRLASSDDALAKAQAQVTQLTASLSQVQKENQTLQARLSSSRGASVTVESASNSRTPGSAMKVQQRTLMVGSAEAAQAAQVSLLKEDLYSDLTGLILRGVERGNEADVYDCIQTGRNGSKSDYRIFRCIFLSSALESSTFIDFFKISRLSQNSHSPILTYPQIHAPRIANNALF